MKPKHLSIIAKKEFRGLFNERTILLAGLLQLCIALFSSFLIVGLTSMYDPSSLSKYSHYRYNVGYAGNSSEILSNLRVDPALHVYVPPHRHAPRSDNVMNAGPDPLASPCASSPSGGLHAGEKEASQKKEDYPFSQSVSVSEN